MSKFKADSCGPVDLSAVGGSRNSMRATATRFTRCTSQQALSPRANKEKNNNVIGFYPIRLNLTVINCLAQVRLWYSMCIECEI